MASAPEKDLDSLALLPSNRSPVSIDINSVCINEIVLAGCSLIVFLQIKPKKQAAHFRTRV
jgi:hypothetical protein